MTIEVMTWAFHRTMTDPTDKFVLVALADHADEHWKCWPSIERLAKFTAYSESTVRRALRRLESYGAISVNDRPGTSRVYQINRQWGCQGDTPAQNDTPVSSDTPPLPTGDTPPLSVVTPEPSLNRQRTPKGEKRASRLPEDWKPTDEQVNYAREQGCPNPQRTALDFKEYWLSHGKRMVDWNLTWRGWCRRERQFNPRTSMRPAQGGFNL